MEPLPETEDMTLTLPNLGDADLTWELAYTMDWVNCNATSGTIPPTIKKR